MKRKGYLYHKIYDLDNLNKAELKAKRGKNKQTGVIQFNKNRDSNLLELHQLLKEKKYKTSNYRTFTIYEEKKRIIHQLPYKDRIVHWAIINVIGDILNKTLTKDSYSNIKNRGIHLCLKNLNKEIKKYRYCLKLDISKYYYSIDKEILKSLLRKKFKDKDLLNLLYEIINSNKHGLPIGNLTSQILGNFYLSYFLHYLKQDLKIKDLYLYCDDLVILENDKNQLRVILSQIKSYLANKLNLELSNYQIFPIESRGIDFLGYVSFHTHIILRKRIKLKFIKMIKGNRNKKSIVSYNGWLKWGNCINLKNKYLCHLQ